MEKSCWISIVSYASKNNISISTIRRSIKSGSIKYKIEDGKYFLFDEIPNSAIEIENRHLREEIIELKMLLSAYEQEYKNEPPPLPV